MLIKQFANSYGAQTSLPCLQQSANGYCIILPSASRSSTKFPTIKTSEWFCQYSYMLHVVPIIRSFILFLYQSVLIWTQLWTAQLQSAYCRLSASSEVTDLRGLFQCLYCKKFGGCRQVLKFADFPGCIIPHPSVPPPTLMHESQQLNWSVHRIMKGFLYLFITWDPVLTHLWKK